MAAAAKAKDLIPIAFGNKEQWESLALFSIGTASNMGGKKVDQIPRRDDPVGFAGGHRRLEAVLRGLREEWLLPEAAQWHRLRRLEGPLLEWQVAVHADLQLGIAGHHDRRPVQGRVRPDPGRDGFRRPARDRARRRLVRRRKVAASGGDQGVPRLDPQARTRQDPAGGLRDDPRLPDRHGIGQRVAALPADHRCDRCVGRTGHGTQYRTSGTGAGRPGDVHGVPGGHRRSQDRRGRGRRAPGGVRSEH